MVAKPSNWNDISDKMVVDVVDIINRTGITVAQWTSLSKTENNSDTLLQVRILDPYYQYQEYYETTVLLPYDIKKSKVFKSFFFPSLFFEKFGIWESGIKLYVLKSEIESIQTNLQNIMIDNRNVIIYLALLFCSLTIAAVVIFSFKVTMSISKPLKKLINAADLVNDKITEQRVLENVRNEIHNLPEVTGINYSINTIA